MREGILWLTENYPPQRGGMAQSCDRIIAGLRSRGIQIHIIHFTNRREPFKEQQQLDGTYTAIPFGEDESHTLNVAWQVVEKFKGVKAMVSFGGYLSLLAAPVYAKWLETKLLTCIRGNDFDASIFSSRKRKLIEDSIRASEYVLTVTTSKKEKINKLFEGVEVRAVQNGIVVEQWKPGISETDFAANWRADRTHNGKKVCIGLFGQLKQKKGGRFFLETLAKFPVINELHFLFIGELDDELREIILEKEISYDVLPFMDRYELIRYYLCCDAIAIPSFYDGMPNVLLEAGALGIPVIASDVDGMQELIEHKVSGLLFGPGDESECRKAVYDFMEMSADERQVLGLNLKKEIEENYTHQKETLKYETIIHSL